jgi:O-antigen ligase
MLTDALSSVRNASQLRRWLTPLVILTVLSLSAYFGLRASPLWLALLTAGLGGVALLAWPALGLPMLLLAALVVPLEISTGTEVKLNAATLLIPALLVLWLLDRVRRRNLRLVPSATTRPLALFLLAGLFSLLIGRATWDPAVPMGSNFMLVQMAQWSIFAFSAGVFWLAGNQVRDERWLWRLTAVFLILGGGVAIARLVPGAVGLTGRFTTIASSRAPFWILLVGLAGGQLLFNRRLSLVWRGFLLATLAASLVYAFVQQLEAISNFVGLAAVLGTLVWLRFPRLRLLAVAFILALALTGVLFPAVYQFAGGDKEWRASGAPRLVLIQRVVQVTMRNPITGLGPAAYRPYADMTPLQYGQAYWISPMVNSHNNYVDIFAHTGLLGLGLFLWFMAEVAWLAWRLRRRFQQGFVAGYANGMLAAWIGTMAVMLLLDWFLPFVYNVGFPGFQASVLVWLFMGGLVAIEQWASPPAAISDPDPGR